MHARRCIMKAGCLDNYLLYTKPEKIGSRFGLYLRSLIVQKMRDPEKFKMPIIPGASKQRRTRSTTYWEHRRVPPVHIPARVRATHDTSAFY